MEPQTIPTDRNNVHRCVEELALYIASMAGHAPHTPQDNAQNLLETRMMGARYSLRIVCSSKRLKRIIAIMTQPYDQQFVLGQLRPDGSPRLFQAGVNLFMSYLVNEGLLEDFHLDLEESLALSARPCCKRADQAN